MVAGRLPESSLLLLLAVAASASYFEVLTPYEGEIFDQEDVYFEFRLHGHLADAVKSGAHEILVGINGNEAMRTVPRQGCPRQPVFMLVDAFLDACT